MPERRLLFLGFVLVVTHLVAFVGGAVVEAGRMDVTYDSWQLCEHQRTELRIERERYAEEWSACVDELRSRK